MGSLRSLWVQSLPLGNEGLQKKLVGPQESRDSSFALRCSVAQRTRACHFLSGTEEPVLWDHDGRDVSTFSPAKPSSG